MKKFSILGCIAAALLCLVGCEPEGNNGYEGTNYIYLDSEGGKTSLLGLNDDPITVNVTLTASLEEDLILNFVINDDQNILEVTGNPVTIPAGSKKASFTIGVADVEELQASSNFTVTLAEDAVLPEKVQFKEDFSFSVVVIEVPELTAEQNAILSTYMAATGINLAKYLGELNVSVEYVAYDFMNEELLEAEPFTGKTVITLSESSTSEAPVLKMLSNPMGIQDKMYALLRALTVEYTDYWCDGEYFPDNVNLMNAISWNADSQETFSMSLDGITFGAEGAIEFVGTGVDQYGDEITIVPFSYEFTAYDRELQAIENGTFVKEDEFAFDCTANPAYHLNNTSITEEYAKDEFDEDCNWVETSATISDNALVFTFCMATAMDDYYTRVVATYTPNN